MDEGGKKELHFLTFFLSYIISITYYFTSFFFVMELPFIFLGELLDTLYFLHQCDSFESLITKI